MRRERAFRGISKRLAIHYLTGLGGEQVGESRVEGDAWSVTLSTDTVNIGPSLTLTEVTLVFEGDPETLPDVIDRFAQKAMRAGG